MKTNTPATSAPASTPAQPVMPIKTKHLAAQFKLKATALRRILRTMPEYADGIHTNYAWAENDKRIPAIAARIKQLSDDKIARAAAAKLALDTRAATLAASAKADATVKA